MTNEKMKFTGKRLPLLQPILLTPTEFELLHLDGRAS